MVYEKLSKTNFLFKLLLSSSDKLCILLKKRSVVQRLVFGSAHCNIFIRYLDEGIKSYFPNLQMTQNWEDS